MSASVLFDAPGPKARTRHLILTVIGALLALAGLWVVIGKMRQAGQLEPALWEPFVTDKSVWVDYLLVGLWNTIKAALLSVVFAGLFGLLLGMGRLSENKWIRWPAGAIVEFFRAVPVLIMMIFLFFGYFAKAETLPADWRPLFAVVIALTLYNGSVIAELVRSGVHSLPKGQGEAGLSIGLTPQQTLRAIQLPQALTAMLPALIGQFVVVLKDTALGVQITYPELLTWAKTLGSSYGNTVPAYLVAALLFILLNYAMTKLATWVERRLKRRGTTAGKVTNAMPTIVQGGAEPGGPAAAGTRAVVAGAEETIESAIESAKERRNDPGW
ncbi:MAG TPA: amino acid ABC transporter permease [Phycicoccus elongatus]|jgi:glutamate transport system permease protein|uniref:amino acid ABC transporter permease n=1 Tax=Phycicoccus TaxID=367298 RepID=UPI001DFB742E|nr:MULTISPECIES: amino acid ABC transporter permease [Phycicoccus]MBK8728132.1 amino acid ABC transporter permease [Tetrasphaera sp.]MCA0323428.1 amino acid ABC transporter permease [Actinomycetota bacterium]MCB1239695.1 amino acid ABC transporter permease [Tetrasphaera sp.]MCB9405256.1 amino acid ABC transporter permease [Tetrasphaera sp.]MCO5303649.1 amino acid ABC transporter permease [Phycicoccus sp.]